jgi:hypothetical protein
MTRFEKAQMERSRHTLSGNQLLQADALARHYTSCTTIALHLRELVEMSKLSGGNDQTSDTIQILIEKLKKAHREDLGLELEWASGVTS